MMTDQENDKNSYLEDPDETSESETVRNINPEELIDEIEKASQEIDQLHSKITEAGTRVGFSVQALNMTKDRVMRLIQSREDPFTYQPVINSLHQEVVFFRHEASEVSLDSTHLSHKVAGLASTSYTLATTSGSIVDSVLSSETEDFIIPYEYSPKSSEIKDALTNIDPNLFDTYREIEQILYNTKADNVKMALVATRQAFDHFFERLAPDDEVRASKYWKPKLEEGKENQIYRIERVRYAIATHVEDTFRASTLLASSQNIIATYNVLNKLHTRGKVNLKATKQAIYTIRHFLEELAIEISI